MQTKVTISATFAQDRVIDEASVVNGTGAASTSWGRATGGVAMERSFDSSITTAPKTDLSMLTTPVPNATALTQPLRRGGSVVTDVATNLDPPKFEDQKSVGNLFGRMAMWA